MDNNHQDLKPSEIIHDDVSNLEKLTQSYLLLKQKICETHEVIRQYNDKLKECERLKTDLDTATKQTKKVTCNYNSTLAKVIKLEIQNTEYKKSIETLTEEVNEHKVKAAADQQHIQQLICKIKDVEGQQNDKIMQYDIEKSFLQVKVKELEQELKTVKKSYDTKIKKMEKKIPMESNSNNHNNNKVKMKDIGINTTHSTQLINTTQTKDVGINTNLVKPINRTQTKDVGINTNLIQSINAIPKKDVGINTILSNDIVVKKPEVKEKSIMTNEFYNVKDDMYPIFCAKCEVLLEPAPLEKICKIMTNSCPRLIEQITSPLKQVSAPLEVASDINNEQCKPENMKKLVETLPIHLQNRNNRADFISVNLLSSDTSIALNRSDYCSNFPQGPNLMNQTAYYLGSTPVNPLSLSNSNVSNQNNHCENIGAVASSLSIISSLQKRIDTLEKKIKQKFNKAKSEQNGSCWQHMHPNPCCIYDINNSMQLNFIEMWKRMTDHDDSKQKKEIDRSKCRKSSSKKCKLSRLKFKKKLQSEYTDSWKIESVGKQVEQSPLRKRLKKRKHRHCMLLVKSDTLPNNTEVLNKSVSDSDTNLCDGVFNDTINTDNNIESKNLSFVNMSDSHTEASNELRTSTHSAQLSDTDEIAEMISNSITCSKLAGGETDSGILSDSVESSKLLQLDGDTDTYSNSVESKNPTDIKSSIQNTLPTEIKLMNSQSTEKSPIKVVKLNSTIKASVDLETLKSLEYTEKVEDKNGKVQFNGVILPIKTPILETSVRKRKLSETHEVNKFCNRGELLKKLKNLKKSNKIVKTCQGVLDHQEIQDCEDEKSCVLEEKKHISNETAIIKEDNYIPRKRPRIAHVPKNTIIEQEVSFKSSTIRKCSETDIVNTINLHSIPDNGIKSNTNIRTEQPKVIQKDSLDLSKSPSVTLEVMKEDNNKELQNKCSNKIDNLKPNVSNTVNFKKIDVTENYNVNRMSFTDIKHSSEKMLSNHSNNFTISNVSNSSKKVIEFKEMKADLNGQCENSKQVYENSISEIKNDTNRSSVIESQVSENSNCNKSCNSEKESVSQLDLHPNHNINNYTENNITSKNDIVILPNEGIRKIVKTEHSYNSNNPLLNSKDMSLIKVEESNVNEINFHTKEVTSKNDCIKEENSTMEVKEKSHSLLEMLQQYITQNKCVSRNYKNELKKLLHVRLITDKFVKKHLQRLMDSEWETSVHWDVIEKLKSTCSPRIIAKGIIDFLSTEQEYSKVLDNSYTPPAPLMTKAQQRIIALLVDLKDPMTFQFVQTGIEYKLFRLNHTIERWALESLARMYTVLARVKKDREKVRIFCCDALYCLGLNAVTILYTVFTCWPEVFPNHEINNKLLPKCMAHLIVTQQGVDFPKLHALKNLVSVFYKYPMGTLSKDLLTELLTALQERSHSEIETAIILLAKKEGTTWTYKHVIRGALLPMIINSKLPSTYRAFCLLGNLMRAFPVEDSDNSVGEIVEQLCDLINSGEGSDEQQEGVVSALLSLSRHKFNEVVSSVIKWNPNGAIHDRTIEQFSGLSNLRTIEFWKSYLRKQKLIPPSPKKCKT